MEKDEIIVRFTGRRFVRTGETRNRVEVGEWYLGKAVCFPIQCAGQPGIFSDGREILRELPAETPVPQPDLLAEAAHALECVWAGVPDGVRRSLAEGADNLRSNSIVVIPVLPEVLRKIESVLDRIRAAKEKP